MATLVSIMATLVSIMATLSRQGPQGLEQQKQQHLTPSPAWPGPILELSVGCTNACGVAAILSG